MFLDDVLQILANYKKQFPHRQIEIRGDFQAVVEDGVKLRISCPPIIEKDETQGN